MLYDIPKPDRIIEVIDRLGKEFETDWTVQSDNTYDTNSSVKREIFFKALTEMFQYLRCDKYVCIYMMTLLRRMFHLQLVNSRSLYRICLGCSLLALKFDDEQGIHNRQFASLVGLPLRDISNLENTTLKYLDWRLMSNEEEDIIMNSLFS